MEYHKVVDTIKSLLEEKGVLYKCFEHKAVRTSEEASSLRPEYSLSQGTKALIIRVKVPNEGKKFVMAVVPGDKRFDQKKLQKHFGYSSIRFATEEEVSDITSGVLPGGVPPFGNLFTLR